MAYNPRIADKICSLIAADYTIEQIAALDDMPGKRTIYDWLRLEETFRTNIARARVAQAENHAELIRKTINDIQNSKISPDAGREVIRGLQWLAGKKAPKVYGDKVTLAGDAENPLFSLGKRLDQLQERQKTMIDVTPDTPALPAPGSELC